MGTKELGQVDPSGNYGMSQAEADKARLWARERARRINADPSIPRRHRAGKAGDSRGSFRPPGRACVVCEARFLRIVPKGTPPLCSAHIEAWEGGGLPEVRKWVEDGDLVDHPWLGMVWLSQAVFDPTVTGEPVTKGSVTIGRPRKHGSNAERQAAYRAKVKAARKAKR